MASGVKVNSDVNMKFDQLKKRVFRCAVFKINDDMTEIKFSKSFPSSKTGADHEKEWGEVQKDLPSNDCRYVVYDFVYEHQGDMKNRIVFALWSPPGAKIKAKMIYASSQEGIVNKLEGIQRQLQCMDYDDLKYEAVAMKLKAHTAGY